MDALDHRHRRGDVDHEHGPYDRHQTAIPSLNGKPAHLRCPSRPRPDRMPDGDVPGYTLMVAGRRTGKTSFLRLLLDTNNVASSVSRDQLASVAKFVQGSSGHTSHVRTVSIDIDLAPDELDEEHPLTLTLIDTPSLDFEDKHASERALQDILRHVEGRLAESLDDERKAHRGDHHVHLCVYFLDPNYIVPPSVPAPPAPLVPRARTNSLSTHESEPVILDPPVTSNPVLCRPILPPTDIAAIRRLSARVNVLPVVACADTLTTDRLTSVKMAIRRDLAEAGIGFGIFDLDIPLYAQLESKVMKHKSENGYMKHLNGASNSPPSTPITPTLLRLPFSLISPDIYSHSDGVARAPLSRSELMHQYAPSKRMAPKTQSVPKVVPGKFVRNYRWGSLDVMDASHCEFLHLRGAIFHHMETLQKYTREYLFEKFKTEVQPPPPVGVRASQPAAVNRLPPMRGSRPILAIDTAPSHANANGHPPLSVPRSAVTVNGEPLSAPVMAATALQELSPKTAASASQSHPIISARLKGGRGRMALLVSAWLPLPLLLLLPPSGPRSGNPLAHAARSAPTGSQRQRAKKITVACNFCRSRKLKCDGGRPACGQCYKRSNPCDYTASNKRRTSGKQRKHTYGNGNGNGSESEGGDSLEDGSGEIDHPSQSPEVPSSAPHSRRSSNVSMLLTEPLPPLSAAVEPREEASAVLPPITTSTGLGIGNGNGNGSGNMNGSVGGRRASMNTELPPIATLSAPACGGDEGAYKDGSESASSRRRTPSVSVASGRSGRGGGGSKIVACNFCRARKTRCDGAHPSCSSCSRRKLSCNYVNEPAAAAAAAKARSKSNSAASPPDASTSASSRSSPASSGPVSLMTPSISESVVRTLNDLDSDVVQHPAKKIRLMAELSAPSIAVLTGP
ncbi:hypothetical protein C8Q79DRAFT_1008469 [Trametes meyenii]|nr:hypothetical protein C8Q79DRAFT_1008469 [Trametes meyenii]